MMDKKVDIIKDADGKSREGKRHKGAEGRKYVCKGRFFECDQGDD